jgi:hypothetical protein
VAQFHNQERRLFQEVRKSSGLLFAIACSPKGNSRRWSPTAAAITLSTVSSSHSKVPHIVKQQLLSLLKPDLNLVWRKRGFDGAEPKL